MPAKKYNKGKRLPPRQKAPAAPTPATGDLQAALAPAGATPVTRASARTAMNPAARLAAVQHSYVRPELLRIVILTVVIVAILLALAFALPR